MVQTSPAIQSHFFIHFALNNTTTDADRFCAPSRDVASPLLGQRRNAAHISFVIRRVYVKAIPNAKVAGNTIMAIVLEQPIGGPINRTTVATIPAGDPSDFDSGEIAVNVNAGDGYALGLDTRGQGGGGLQLIAHFECYVLQNQGNRD